jgi:acetyl-CoA acetyltransferase family protein
VSHAPDRRPVLAAGLRLPQARAGGRFAREDPAHLGAALLREFLAQLELDAGQLDEVIVGNVGAPHDQANVARVIALRAGIPRHVPAFTVARNCASGMQAVTSAMDRIQAGRGDLFLCLGVEVMSAYPLVFNERGRRFFQRLAAARTPLAKAQAGLTLRPSAFAPRIALTEGLTDPISGLIMGSTAELLAREFGIEREQADRYALTSHVRAAVARDGGRFQREILPYLPFGSRPGEAALASDDGIRDNQTPEALAKLGPYFEKPDGVVTVGNACGITDGATALLVTSAARARGLGLRPLAALRDYAWSGCDPARMGLGPVHASAKLLTAAGMRLGDIGAVELNEAFAVQVLACQQAFASEAYCRDNLGAPGALGEIDPARLNKNGGAIALGHPVGATGARLLLTTAHELAVSDCELGLATLCIGGGQGGAVLLERL